MLQSTVVASTILILDRRRSIGVGLWQTGISFSYASHEGRFRIHRARELATIIRRADFNRGLDKWPMHSRGMTSCL